jgi:hypothetical protein
MGIQLGTDPFSEAPTRNFDERRDRGLTAPAPGVPEPGAPYQTGPQYMPPGVARPSSGPVFQPPVTGYPVRANTAPMEGKKKAPVFLIVATFVLVGFILFGSLIVALVIKQVKSSGTAGNNPPKTQPAKTPVAAPPDDGDEPPGAGSIDSSKLPDKIQKFVYPDADVSKLVEMPGGKGVVVEMTTDDDVDEVFDWYSDQLKDEKDLHRTIDAKERVLIGGGTVIAIKPKGDRTGISVISGMPGMPGALPGGIPPVPPIPAPPAPPAPGAQSSGSSGSAAPKAPKTPNPSKTPGA